MRVRRACRLLSERQLCHAPRCASREVVVRLKGRRSAPLSGRAREGCFDVPLPKSPFPQIDEGLLAALRDGKGEKFTSGNGYALVCGDCLEVLPRFPDDSVDFVCADIPYGTTGAKRAKDNKDVPFTEDQWKTVLMPELRRILKPGGRIMLLCDFGQLENFCGWKLKMDGEQSYPHYWFKTNKWTGAGFTVNKKPLHRTDLAYVIYKDGTKFNYREVCLL